MMDGLRHLKNKCRVWDKVNMINNLGQIGSYQITIHSVQFNQFHSFETDTVTAC